MWVPNCIVVPYSSCVSGRRGIDIIYVATDINGTGCERKYFRSKCRSLFSSSFSSRVQGFARFVKMCDFVYRSRSLDFFCFFVYVDPTSAVFSCLLF